MHLKSLTLRGFKSFASATTLRLEPGITCVVGPNGSGKSNVVDALTWVMGEQGAKSLRGGAMSDVVFAGAAGRPALGRAEVTLTFDNSDGRLPVDAADVSVTRLLFRGGGSEYAINGSACRLLDVQELLSDAGIGREMHVVVGQGRLDSVLQATPEERRALLEEAAGVLKHRRRKEKALRKLDAVAGNQARLDDLVGELSKRLKPLGRQAKAARRAAVAQAVVRDARRRLLADDLVAARRAAARDAEQAAEVAHRRAAVEESRTAARTEVERLAASVAAADAVLAEARGLEARLVALRERLRGTARVASQRAELLSAPQEDAPSGRDPERLERDAAAARAEQARLDAAVADGQAALAEAVRVRAEAEQALVAEEKALAARRRAVLDRREGLARLQAQAEAARSRATAAVDEVPRLERALADARGRVEALQAELAAAQSGVGALDADEAALDAAHEEAEAARADAEERVRGLREQERALERDRSAAVARAEALRLGLREGGAPLPDDAPGVLGALPTVVRAVPGGEAALAAALGGDAEALGVHDLAAAVALLERVRDGGAAVRLLVGDAPPLPPAGPAPDGGTWAAALVAEAPDALRPALDRVLAGTVVVDDLAAARALVTDDPTLRVVTRGGELLAAAQAAGGSGGPSRLELRAAADAAAAQAETATAEAARVREALAAATAALDGASARAETALAALHESDAAIAASAERLAERASALSAAVTDVTRTEDALSRARDLAETARRAAAEVEDRWAAASAAHDDDGDEGSEPSGAERDRLAAAAAAARGAEVEARLAVRTAEERQRGAAGRAEGLERAARAERAARERAAARRAERARSAAVAAAVDDAARVALERLEEVLAEAVSGREDAEGGRGDDAARLAVVREHLAGLEAEHAALVEAAHRDDVARAELRLRVEALELRVRDETGLTPDALVAEAGPHVPVVDPDETAAPAAQPADEDGPAAEGGSAEDGAAGDGPADDGPAEDAPAPVGRPWVRAEAEAALAEAEAELARIGAVNPLALEEYAAVEQRHEFLTEQLADLSATRRDLLAVVRDVDTRVRDAVRSAFDDAAREFETVFETLFPGGEGRLVLTDPDDLLTTGVEVEARPPGKRVKRLSLLSGGERSLTAVAFLVALFRARPSPFYVLDEVEAALDDTNLRRLLALLEQLRRTSQLIVVTHQKRTMEIADALYGVTMREGTSTVVSQRLRRPDDADRAPAAGSAGAPAPGVPAARAAS